MHIHNTHIHKHASIRAHIHVQHNVTHATICNTKITKSKKTKSVKTQTRTRSGHFN